MSKAKLAVTIWNYKGGVGKSTIAHILAQIGVQRGQKVLAIDLDEQRNLEKTLRLSASLYPSIEVRRELKKGSEEEDFNLYVIDTHPTKSADVIKALKFADIILVPVLGEYHSLINLREVWDYVISAGVGEGQIAIVKNCMDNSRLTAEVEELLSEYGYATAGRLPRSKVLLRNLASGVNWDRQMGRSRFKFMELYEKVMSAYHKMVKGQFIGLLYM